MNKKENRKLSRFGYGNAARLFFPIFSVLFLTGWLAGALLVREAWGAPSDAPPDANGPNYPVHVSIITTIFWVGEAANGEDGYIPNDSSVWDNHWMDHYGGTDDPKNRSGYYPAGFQPRENPFYFALPYNDFTSGERKTGAYTTVYWAAEKSWGSRESMCKNRWIKITKGDQTAYAQWQDVGPFLEDDADYVFGIAPPSNTQLSGAGLDVSPAVRDYLNLQDVDRVDWQFVNESDVPSGPWKTIVTTRQVDWD